MKKILVIEESPLFRNYLTKKLSSYGFEVIQGSNGLDGSVKMRNAMPDLIIMDYYLSRKSSIELLEEKHKNRNVADVPVLMVTTKIDRQKVVELAKYNVKKIISKPLKMEQLLKAISALMGVELKIDSTPCVIEAHFNENILFIEIAQGLNTEKIEQLQYKINELLELYDVRKPRVLLMMSSLEFPREHHWKLHALLEIITNHAQPNAKFIKILTSNKAVTELVEKSEDFGGIGVYDNLEKAMDSVLGLKADSIAHDEVVRERLLKTSAPSTEKEETIQLRFDSSELSPEERKAESESHGAMLFNREAEVAIVDDDVVIQELLRTVFAETKWKVTVYENGKEFVEDREHHDFSLAFLDLMMPEMNGFQVLEHLKKSGDELPVIVFSALSKKETVLKAVSYGIKSYLTKPLKPAAILRKTAEVMAPSF
ncbi:MAG TPA: response regulator [Sediminispirochaeta sp.]|nr:response regulator [Sediminispirochaeta sp.]